MEREVFFFVQMQWPFPIREKSSRENSEESICWSVPWPACAVLSIRTSESSLLSNKNKKEHSKLSLFQKTQTDWGGFWCVCVCVCVCVCRWYKYVRVCLAEVVIFCFAGSDARSPHEGVEVLVPKGQCCNSLEKSSGSLVDSKHEVSTFLVKTEANVNSIKVSYDRCSCG